MITLLYLIIISHVKDREKYLPIFFNKLLENKITPSIIIILMNNEGHQYFDFEYLRKIHKNNKKKQKKNLLCKSHIFNNRNPPTKNLAISNIDVKIKDLANEEENIKEIIITKIAQIKHKHDFESDDIYGDYHCKDNVCSELFEKTKCFYGKFDFLITLLYLIIISHVKDREKYLPIFFNKLLENKITPSIIIILMNNEGHQYFDFEYLRKIHKNNKKKQKKNLLCKSHIFNNRNPPTKNLAISNIDVKIKDLANEEENIKEIIITKIAQIKHKHDFESDDIYGDYHCKDNVCSEYMSFYIDSNILNKECDKYENIINPKYIINDLFTKILEENNLFIFPNDKMIDDIKQIAMYDQLYFHIGYFRNDDN